MKKLFLLTLISVLTLSNLNAQLGLDYYMPKGVEFDENIPQPSAILGYEVGEWMISHDQLIHYLETIAASTDRAVLKEYARSHENRPLYTLIFSSPENIKNLDGLRQEHLKITDPSISANINTADMPLVVRLGYSVHGNEASGINSSLLTMYYLAAAKGEEFEKFLKNTIIIVDPAMNPDGANRFANWINMHKSKADVIDPNSRIYNEMWPNGRTNHYWFELNRDYLLLVNPESQGRVNQIQMWRPNIVTDHHEMGSNSTFFFQPGVPSRVNPLTPPQNQRLTERIGDFHTKFLDEIGTLYFTEEVFDDYYFGKGSAYPDINSGVGILFEQATTRGFKRQTDNGIIDFSYTIKNQFTVTLSTLEAAKKMRVELLDYQKDFFTSAFELADKDPSKAIVFGGVRDYGRTMELVKFLKNHSIKVHQLNNDLKAEGKEFTKGNSFLIPLKQQNYRLIKSLFEVVHNFKSQTFYDISSWNMAMTFNVLMAEVKDKKHLNSYLGDEVLEVVLQGEYISDQKKVTAWAFDWNEYYAPRALTEILSLGLRVKVAQKPFTYQTEKINKEFSYGTILIPAFNQELGVEEIEKKLEMIAKRDGIAVYALQTALTPSGIDLGSSYFRPLKAPRILMLVEGQTSSRDAGEIWHLFDDRYNCPITLLEVDRMSRVEVSNYNVIILPGGSYSDLPEAQIEKMKTWLNNGGTMIAYKGDTNWASKTFDLKIEFKETPKIEKEQPVYSEMYEDANVQAISGAIFNTEIDLSHPLAFGYTQKYLPVFKSGLMVAKVPDNPYTAPIRYTNDPLLSGYCSDKNKNRIKGAPFAMVSSIGTGRIISIFDNTNFRGIWYGTNKIFANAVFFGHLIQLGPQRYYEE